MKGNQSMKRSVILRAAFTYVILALVTPALRGQDATYGNVTVTGTGDFQGASTMFGTWSGSGGGAGLILNYSGTGATTQVNFIGSGSATTWQWWQYNGTTNLLSMKLDSENQLILYTSGTNGTVGITLNPASSGTSSFASSMTISGTDNELPNQSLVAGASILTEALADGRYLQLSGTSNFVPSSYLFEVTGTATTGTGPGIALLGGTATGSYTFAGMFASATARKAVAIGYGAIASGSGAAVYGPSSTASAANSLAIGISDVASGTFSSAIGITSVASGRYSVAIGYYAHASGIASTALGNSFATGDNSLAMGPSNTASGFGSTSLGIISNATGDRSIAAGFQVTAAGYNQFVIGENNIVQGSGTNWTGTDNLFVIGNGADFLHPSNAFVVNQNGDTTVNGALVVSGTSGTLSKIVNGGLAVTGTAVDVVVDSGTVNTVVATGSNNLLLVPQQGDLSMGEFVGGAQPPH